MIHGQKRSEKKKSEEQVKEENELSEKINSRLSEFFDLRGRPILKEKVAALMEFTTILMQLCSDISTIFNYRRELVLGLLAGAESQSEKAQVLGSDMKLITKIIQGDPKSYTLWSYRQWLVVKLFPIDPSVIQKEKELCRALLAKDEKNFHVWNYRNWANSIQLDREQELGFTQDKINSNPFNFSPYHFRSKHLCQKYSAEYLQTQEAGAQLDIITYGMPRDTFRQEMETVKTAIFLNPREEAPWLYHSWLLKQILPSILLRHHQQPDGSVLLEFSLKVSDITALVRPEDSSASFKVCSDSPLSQKWTVCFEGEQRCPLEIISSLEQRVGVKLETGGRWVIGSRRESTEAVEQVLATEKEFIREVLESEENQCRFAWMELLEVMRGQILVGVSPSRWEELTLEAWEVFAHLEGGKGAKYMGKQQAQWGRRRAGTDLSGVEQLLKGYRK